MEAVLPIGGEEPICKGGEGGEDDDKREVAQAPTVGRWVRICAGACWLTGGKPSDVSKKGVIVRMNVLIQLRFLTAF